VLNHPNFDCITTNASDATSFGKSSCVVGDGGVYGPGTGSWANGVARRFQFSAKVLF
jgi:hypothetical protein